MKKLLVFLVIALIASSLLFTHEVRACNS